MLLRPMIAAIFIACLWDYDTIRMERERFPDVHEVLAGKFTRHSPAYYEWRIKDRTHKLEADPRNLALIDDLAVAHEKLGQPARAIERMQESLTYDPQRYETHANLGTFHIHAGNFEKGLEHIRKAIEINPDAHFGREVVQARLVEYVLEARAALGPELPLRVPDKEQASWHALQRGGFASFTPRGNRIESEALVRGIVGMMFFGQHDHPILAEALGDALASARENRLATRAYLKAGSNAPTDDARRAYRKLAKAQIGSQVKPGIRARITDDPVELDTIEARFRDELAEGAAFFAAIEADEKEWSAAGLDLDAEFARKYYAVGRTEPVTLPWEWHRLIDWLMVGGFVAVIVVALAYDRRRRAKKSA